jgi:CubicO group peptidase (beta-lactamase class C family)
MTPDSQERCFEQVTVAVEAALAGGPVTGAVLGIDGPHGRWLRTVGSGLTADAVMRLSSLTKPLVAVAALAAAHDGVLSLDDPVDRWVPELAAPRVLRHPGAALGDTVECEHRTTVRDLLTMRLGTGFAFELPDSAVAEAAASARLGWGPPVPTEVPHTPDEWIGAFAALPLMEQPGRWWRYGTAFSLLGVLLARAEGRPLPDVLRARVTEPLGLADTAFQVDPAKTHRLVDCLLWSGEGDAGVLDTARGSAWSEPPRFRTVPEGWLAPPRTCSPSAVRCSTQDEGMLRPARRCCPRRRSRR